MVTQIPSIGLIRRRLAALSMVELEALAKDSGVSFGALIKIRLGTTDNPGIETVRKFWPFIEDAGKKPARKSPKG